MTDSKDIFVQYCTKKADSASEFLSDYILYKLDAPITFEGEKYKSISEYLLDFMVAADELFNVYYFMVSLPTKKITKERFESELNKQVGISDKSVASLLFGVFMANVDKFLILKNKEVASFDNDELKNYKVNIMYDFCHSKINAMESKLNVLLKVDKNDNTSQIFQIEDKKIDSFIDNLKDIYCQIKS